MASPHQIGVFDSGVGGLTVVREILRQLPKEQVIYFGDTLHLPYGSRPVDELISFADGITSYLLEQGAEMIVVACNTSASVSMDYLKSKLAVPIVGVVEPGAKSAATATRNKRIGVIATEATVKSGSYVKSLAAIDPEIEVYAQACPLFVPLVEAGLSNTDQAKAIARTYLKTLQEQNIDTLILGCTHYPYLIPVLQEILGPWVTLVDPAQATVQEVALTLTKPDFELAVPAFSPSHAGNKGTGSNRIPSTPQHAFYVSGDPDLFAKVGSTFLDGLIPDVLQVTLGE